MPIFSIKAQAKIQIRQRVPGATGSKPIRPIIFF